MADMLSPRRPGDEEWTAELVERWVSELRRQSDAEVRKAARRAEDHVVSKAAPVATSRIGLVVLLLLACTGLASVPAQAQTRGAESTARRADGSTPLLLAAYGSDLDQVRRLLAAGANANEANRLGLTPLLMATRLGDAAIAHALLKAGADAGAAGPEGETPLMSASAAGNLDIVAALLARGVDVNASEQWQQQTALMWAASEGHTAVVRALLKAGADPNPVAKATELPHTKGDGGRMWVDHPSGGLTALMFAAREGHLAAAAAIADAGADLNHANPNGLDALTIAVINDRLDLAAMLLDKGAKASEAALYEVVQMHNLRTNETAGEATRPRLAHRNTLTPVDLVARLLDKGADPNTPATHVLHLDGTGQPDPVNEAALFRAARAQDVALLELMLARGGNAALVSPEGQPALIAAMGGGRGGFAGGFGATPAGYRYVSERAPIAAMKALIAAGADVNAATRAGDTALHNAAQTGNVAMIQLLADNGATLDAVNRAGLTPLDAATGKRAPGGGARGGGPGPAAPPAAQPQAIALLQKLMVTR